MIQSFRSKDTERLFNHEYVRRFPSTILHTALRKLTLLNAAVDIEDLRVPPGNRLELLRGSRDGQHSIRINDQWRICFQWKDNNAYDVEIIDYHS